MLFYRRSKRRGPASVVPAGGETPTRGSQEKLQVHLGARGSSSRLVRVREWTARTVLIGNADHKIHAAFDALRKLE